MKIQISKFGNLLISRPEGREAFFAARAYIIGKKEKEFILDFAGVDVLTPSWIDEFISNLKKEFSQAEVSYENTDNPSVSESLQWVGK
ncbi:MAG: STAS-like domain-containing protein [Endomicrobium sp.]|jgi:hypothetical protein|nr:STAS-like domain-containing protein [Endomicrobium sp.]